MSLSHMDGQAVLVRFNFDSEIFFLTVETVLSITGAIVGTFLCFVFPSALYIMSVNKDNKTRTVAKVHLSTIFLCP